MSEYDDACAAEAIYAVSPRRLLAAVLAAKPHRFKLVAAHAATMRFTFTSVSGDGGFHLESLLHGHITGAPEGSRFRISGGSEASKARTQAAIDTFLERVRFVVESPEFAGLLDEVARAAGDRPADGDAAGKCAGA
ncbi:hypothetical protein [Nocardioides sp. AE5]|uniref:hypothetical protein n=1 Tax=Nocardioides sp. AE5 TaxID=2962573 RepID=UPI0028827900|nr:hypothetical protein [Nocardioides sp. AE5]MDT0203375.1 hypothetical protein [Nocardioides sp. AE5]